MCDLCDIRQHHEPVLKPRHSVYNTRKSQADGVFLVVPHFATSVNKSSKSFGLSFAYDAPKIGNDLADESGVMMYVWPLLSILSERSSKSMSLHKHIHRNFSFSQFLSVALILAMSQVNDYSLLLFLFWCA